MRTRISSLVLSVLCTTVLVACGGDDVATGANNGANNGDIREEQPGPDTTPCNGCTDSDGNCVAGTAVAACGIGGVTCASCGADQVCSTGACVDEEAPPEECTSDNCAGCCNAEGRCVAGGLDAACGAGGEQCVQCGPGTDCSNGICESTEPMEVVCGPDNCNGCCNAAGTCVAGAARNACGVGGGACVACAADEACNAGACETDPDPDPDPLCADTCTGCCDGETCITAVTDTMCGISGAACLACAGTEECNAGICEMIPVTPTGDTWDLYLVSADIPVFSNYGYEWDALSAPDPFLEAYAENSVGYWYGFSDTKSDTYDPVWNELMFVGLDAEALATGIIFWFQEQDFTGPEEICYVILGVDSTLINGQNITTTCPDEPNMTFTWRLEPTP